MKNVREGDVEDRDPQGRARDGNRLLSYNFFCDAGLLLTYIARQVNGIARGLREKPVVQSGVRRLGLKVAATFTGISRTCIYTAIISVFENNCQY